MRLGVNGLEARLKIVIFDDGNPDASLHQITSQIDPGMKTSGDDNLGPILTGFLWIHFLNDGRSISWGGGFSLNLAAS